MTLKNLGYKCLAFLLLERVKLEIGFKEEKYRVESNCHFTTHLNFELNNTSQANVEDLLVH